MAADALLAPSVAAHRWLQRHLRSAVAVVLLVLVLLPFLWMVLMAFRPAADALELDLVFRPTLDAFRGLWQDSFARSFGNSLLVSVLSTALSMLLGVPAAYALSRWRFKARKQVAKSGSAFAGNLFVAFVLAGLLIFVYLFVKRTAWAGKSLFAGLLLGALNFGNILFYVRAHQVFKDDPTLVFAGMNVGVITLGTLVGALLFREKISRINALGIVLAILSIVSLFYLSKWLPQLA